MDSDATVFIVDDDIAMRDSLSLLLGLKGFKTRLFASAEELLTSYDAHWLGCMLIDVRMAGMSGLDLQAELAARGSDVPVVIMTGYGDVATARTALKAGAADFLEKPVDEAVLIDVLRSAIDAHAGVKRARQPPKSPQRLTEREQQVARLTTAGHTVKQIAAQLGISPRTVEVYKSRMNQKRLAKDGFAAEVDPDSTGGG